MPKPHGTDDEILFLIMRRRMQARQAMGQIVDGFQDSARFPKVAMLLDYLSNMVLCLELMLKLLSQTWENHDLAPLYEKVFGTPYAKSSLLDYIKKAMFNQKYFFEPSSDLATHIPEMEELFLTLHSALLHEGLCRDDGLQ